MHLEITHNFTLSKGKQSKGKACVHAMMIFCEYDAGLIFSSPKTVVGQYHRLILVCWHEQTPPSVDLNPSRRLAVPHWLTSMLAAGLVVMHKPHLAYIWTLQSQDGCTAVASMLSAGLVSCIPIPINCYALVCAPRTIQSELGTRKFAGKQIFASMILTT